MISPPGAITDSLKSTKDHLGPPSRIRLRAIALSGAVAFLTYFFTLSPTINFGDSPELISSAYTLGVSHPPGYPLYSLAAKIFAFLPFGDSIAWRVNLLSAFFAAASVFIVALISYSAAQGESLAAVIFAAFFLAFSPTLWSQAVQSEVYTLNLFLFLLLLCFVLIWWRTQDMRYLMACAFLWGLGLANHHTLVAFFPLFLIFLAAAAGMKRIKAKHLFLFFFFSLLGLSVYVYLPVRSLADPAMDWGDPEDMRRFIEVVLRRQFPTGEGSLDFGKVLSHLAHYLDVLLREFGPIAVLAGLWGMVRSFRLGLSPALFVVLLFIVHGIGTLLFLNPSADTVGDVEIMMIPSFALFALWIGLGTGDLIGSAAGKKWGRVASPAVVVLLSACLALNFLDSLQKNDQRNNYFALDYGKNIFRSVKEGGVVFVESDTSLFPLWYLQYVEGWRPDAAVIDVDFLMLPWFKEQMRERYGNLEIRVEDLGRHSAGKRRGVSFSEMVDDYKVSQVEIIVSDLIDTRPVYISYEFGPVYGRYRERRDTYVIDEGLLFRVSKRYERPDPRIWDAYDLRSLLDYPLPRDPYSKILSLAYMKSLMRRVQVLMREGKRDEAERVVRRIRTIRKEVVSFL